MQSTVLGDPRNGRWIYRSIMTIDIFPEGKTVCYYIYDYLIFRKVQRRDPVVILPEDTVSAPPESYFPRTRLIT